MIEVIELLCCPFASQKLIDILLMNDTHHRSHWNAVCPVSNVIPRTSRTAIRLGLQFHVLLMLDGILPIKIFDAHEDALYCLLIELRVCTDGFASLEHLSISARDTAQFASPLRSHHGIHDSLKLLTDWHPFIVWITECVQNGLRVLHVIGAFASKDLATIDQTARQRELADIGGQRICDWLALRDSLVHKSWIDAAEPALTLKQALRIGSFDLLPLQFRCVRRKGTPVLAFLIPIG